MININYDLIYKNSYNSTTKRANKKISIFLKSLNLGLLN